MQIYYYNIGDLSFSVSTSHNLVYFQGFYSDE